MTDWGFTANIQTRPKKPQ